MFLKIDAVIIAAQGISQRADQIKELIGGLPGSYLRQLDIFVALAGSLYQLRYAQRLLFARVRHLRTCNTVAETEIGVGKQAGRNDLRLRAADIVFFDEQLQVVLKEPVFGIAQGNAQGIGLGGLGINPGARQHTPCLQ